MKKTKAETILALRQLAQKATKDRKLCRDMGVKAFIPATVVQVGYWR